MSWQLSSWNFILADEQFSNALQIFETLRTFESATTFDERLKVTWVPSFILAFNLLSCELDDFTIKVLHWVKLS